MRSDQATDDLLAACRAGDQQAWQQLLDRYERLVFAIAVREGLSVDDAADVTQVTFEALLGQLDRIRDQKQIGSWLMTVARRQAWKARDRRNRCVPVELTPANEPSYEPMADQDLAMWIYDGLSQLGDACRELLTLLYFDPSRPSYRQVAAQLGRPVGAIGPSRARCLGHLRRILGPDSSRGDR